MTDILISTKIKNYLETVNTIFAKLGQKEAIKYFDSDSKLKSLCYEQLKYMQSYHAKHMWNNVIDYASENVYLNQSRDFCIFLGSSYLAIHDYQQAIIFLKKSLDAPMILLVNSNSEILYLIGLCHHRHGSVRAAEKCFEKSIELFDSDSQFNLARKFFGLNCTVIGMKALAKQISIDYEKKFT